MPNFIESTSAVVIIGATSGIGRALAIKLHSAGKTIIVTGRREENLNSLSKELGHERVYTVPWDITDLEGMPAMVEAIVGKYGDRINAVVVVSGVQRTTDFTKPEELDFAAINLEITTNYTAYIHLFAAFLPFLTKLGPTKNPWIGVVSSSLALVPIARTPNYNATKAALHQLVLSIRLQFNESNSPVSIVEVYPPAVKTELHDKKNQPDLPDGYEGMELDDFIAELWKGLEQGKLDIPCGSGKEQWEKIDAPRQEILHAQAEK